MRSCLVRFRLRAVPPRLCDRAGRLTPFGAWLLARFHSARLDWPAVGMEVVAVHAAVVVLRLRHRAAPPGPLGVAVGAALRRETALAACRLGWVPQGAGRADPLWREVAVSADSAQERTRVSSTTAKRRKRAFIDQAAVA